MMTRFWNTLIGKRARTRTRVPTTRLRVESLEARDVPAIVNLTATGVAEDSVNGAIFRRGDATGAGLLQPFVRIQRNGVEQGYNTDARPVQFDEDKKTSFTHSLLLENVPVVTIGGVAYREFILEANQRTGAKAILSLDELRIFVHNTPNL